MQNAGYGLIVPIWLYLHLVFSPTINNQEPSKLMASNPLPLSTLPLSTILAFFIPNFLMSLTPGHALCADNSTKQFYTALSQFWPIFLGGLQIILPIIISAAVPGIITLSEENKKVRSLRYLRRCYAFALISTTCSHLIAFGIPLLAYFAPGLFRAPYLSQLELSNMFVLRSPLPPVQSITSIADGVLSFVQWDLLIGSVSVLVWATTLRVKAQGRGFDIFEWIEGFFKVLGLVCLSGPVGAAAAVVWERDEHIFARALELEDEEGGDEERKDR
jgi:Na+/H+-dicarboxylate symporter